MDIKFITEPNETNKGLIIVDGRYYGLPVEAVKLFKRLYNESVDNSVENQNETQP